MNKMSLPYSSNELLGISFKYTRTSTHLYIYSNTYMVFLEDLVGISEELPSTWKTGEPTTRHTFNALFGLISFFLICG